MDLPKGVHRVISRGKAYYYWHPGRGTAFAGKRTRLPDDPASVAFWTALRTAQGASGLPTIATFNAVADQFETSPQFARLAPGTQDFYRRNLKSPRAGWGNIAIERLTPHVIREFLDHLADTPSAANNMLGTLRALSAWALERGKIHQSFTESVRPYKSTGGHKPWTEAQVAAAHEHLTGATRRGVMLMLYTGQRGSDMVRLGWTDIDDGGFRLRQQKTGREVYCPIVDELAAEMAGWEKRPGPFVTQGEGRANGRPYTRKLFSLHFDEARKSVPALAGVTLHGLRGTAVVRLRMAGLATAQIQDIIGMSMAMIERYSRFADRKQSGKAAVIRMNRQ